MRKNLDARSSKDLDRDDHHKGMIDLTVETEIRHRDVSRDRDQRSKAPGSKSRTEEGAKMETTEMKSPTSDRGSANGSHRSRRRSRSRDR